MTWTLSRSIHRRRTRIPLIHNDHRSYNPPTRPRRFVLQENMSNRPHPSSLSESIPMIGKRTHDESEDTFGTRSYEEEDDDATSQGESSLIPNASGKRLKFMQSLEERHPCHHYQCEEDQCEAGMHASQQFNTVTPVPANAGVITVSDSSSEASPQHPDAPGASDGEGQSIALVNSNVKVTDAKQDDGKEVPSPTSNEEVPPKSSNEEEKTESIESEIKTTQECSSDEELELLYLDPEDWEAEVAEAKDAANKTSTDSTSINVPADEQNEVDKYDITNRNDNSSEPPQLESSEANLSRPHLPVTNDILHKYRSAKVLLDFWAQLNSISTSEDDLIHLFSAFRSGGDHETEARLPSPPIFPLKSCLANSSLLQRLNGPTVASSLTEPTKPTWRSDDGEYELEDVPNDLHDVVQSYLSHLLQKYPANKGWSRDFIIANLRRGILSAKAGLPRALEGETTAEQNEMGIREFVEGKCAAVIEDNTDTARPRRIKFSEEVDCINIDDGTRSQQGHQEEGAWKIFARGTKPAGNSEYESARVQMDGLAPVEDDEEAQQLEGPLNNPDNKMESSGQEEQDQNHSASNSISSLSPQEFTPIAPRQNSCWTETIRNLEDTARDIAAHRSPSPLPLAPETPVPDRGLISSEEDVSDEYSPSNFQPNDYLLPDHDHEEISPDNSPSDPQHCHQRQRSITNPPISPANTNDENITPTKENHPPLPRLRSPILLIRTPPVNGNRYFRIIREANPDFSPPSPEFAHHSGYGDWFDMQDEEMRFRIRRREQIACENELRFVRPESSHHRGREDVDFENHDPGFQVFSENQAENMLYPCQNDEGSNDSVSEAQGAYDDKLSFQVWRDRGNEDLRGEDSHEENDGPGFSVWQDNRKFCDQTRENAEGENDGGAVFTVWKDKWNDRDEGKKEDNAGEDGNPGFTVWTDRRNCEANHDDSDSDSDWYDRETDDLEEPVINIWDNDLDDDDDEVENRHVQVTGGFTSEAEKEVEESDGDYNDENENVDPGFTVWRDENNTDGIDNPSEGYSDTDNEVLTQHSSLKSRRTFSTRGFEEFNEPAASSHFRPRVFHRPTSPLYDGSEYSSPVHKPKEYSPETEYDGQWTPERSPCPVEPGANFEDDEPVASPHTPINRPRVFHRPTSPILEDRLSCPDSPRNNNTGSHRPSTERELPRFSISPVYKRNSSYVSPIYTCAPTPPPPASPVPWYRRYLQDLTPPVCERNSNSTYVSPIYICRPTPPPAPVYNEPRSGGPSPCPFVSPESWPRRPPSPSVD